MGRDPYIGPIPGTVASNKDPEKRGRITVEIPNVFDGSDAERISAWAEPMATSGSGVNRGSVSAPEVGAEVTVFPVFDQQIGQGNPDVLYYLPAGYGEGDVPDEYESEEMRVWATRDYVVVVDEREGMSGLSVRHRPSGDGYSHDPNLLEGRVKATASVVVECSGRIDFNGPAVFLNGRLVMPGGSPIR